MRCIACDSILFERERRAKNKITGTFEDMCSKCRGYSSIENIFVVKNYQLEYVYQGLTRVPRNYYDNFNS